MGYPASSGAYARPRGWAALTLLLLLPTLTLAQPQAWGPWQFRPTPPSNARGVPPTQAPPATTAPQPNPGGAYTPPSGQPSPYGPPPPGYGQAQPPGYGQTQPSAQSGPYQPPGAWPGAGQYQGQTVSASRPPRLTAQLADPRPFVQQPVLVTIEVASPTNLVTASPKLTGFADVLLEQLAGPTASSRRSDGASEVITKYTLALTPLRAGALKVGPLEVTGTLAGGVPFAATAAQALQLDVRRPEPTVLPWLALRALKLDAELDPNAVLAEGRPVGLVLTMQADGALGQQLPSLAANLQSPDFRVYREETRTENTLADDGRHLLGTRTEYYTLVPLSGGRLQLPELRIAWWNVDTGARETSGVPIRTFTVAGEAGPLGLGRSNSGRDLSGGLAWIWMPLTAMGLLLLGYWGGVWLRTRPGTGARPHPPAPAGLAGVPMRLGGDLRESLRALRAALARRLDPQRLRRSAAVMTERLVTALTPRATRVYRCALHAEQARTPAAWASAFQARACQALATRSREPLPRVADRIIALRPGADPARVRALIAQLDTALYNGQPLDFPRWKREFRAALRPGVGGLHGLLTSRVRRAGLPALNPRPTI